MQKTRISILNYIFLILIILIMGLRWEVGGDWPNYFNRYYDVESILDKIQLNRDPLYQFVNNIFSLAGFKYPFFNFATSFFLIYPYYLLLKNVKYKELSLLILFSYCLMIVNPGYVRQAFSIAIFVYLAMSYQKIPLPWMLFWCVIATLFHKSGIVSIIFLLISIQSFLAKIILIGLGLLVLGVQFIEILFNKATDYLESDRYTIGAIIRLVFLAVSAIFYHSVVFLDYFQTDARTRKLLNYGTLIIFALCGIAIFSTTLADRFSLYFLFMIPIIIDGFLIKTKSSISYLIIAFVFSCWVPFWVTFANNADDWLPFQISLEWF